MEFIHEDQTVCANKTAVLCVMYKKMFNIICWQQEAISNGVTTLEVLLVATEVEIIQHLECDTFALTKFVGKRFIHRDL